MIQLAPLHLAIAATLVIALALLTWRLQLGVSGRIVIAAARTVLQLLLLGFVLDYLFSISHPLLIALLAMVMLLIAGYEVMARQQRPFKGLWGYGLGALSMFISSFTIAIFTLNVVISPDPWYLPQYAIPLLGMMLGNTMRVVDLCLFYISLFGWQSCGVLLC